MGKTMIIGGGVVLILGLISVSMARQDDSLGSSSYALAALGAGLSLVGMLSAVLGLLIILFKNS